MLNIYYGRESINKERFMYDRIRQRGYDPGRPVFVVVPDQYTLEAEHQAFRWLETDCLLGLEVCSMSRLGHRVLSELGGGRRAFVDKYGRQMLLTGIVSRAEEELQVFKGRKAGNAFVEMVNNFISELKQYGVTPAGLEELRDRIPGNELLRRKLSDLLLLYRRYQEAIAGKYTDSEDLIDLYAEKIPRSAMFRGAAVWLYGFDSFAPKSMKVIQSLMQAAEEVNVVLTCHYGGRDQDLFRLPRIVTENLQKAAAECGCPSGDHLQILEEYRFTDRKPAIRHLEQELAAVPKKGTEDCQGITLVRAANIYNEAESAAAFVLHLLRDKAYRMRDIVLVCNDQEESARVIARVFQEYGLTVFHDNKRSIEDAPVAVFLLSMLETVAGGWRTRDIFRTLKSGFLDIPPKEVDQLEIYANNYRLRGTMWKKPFRYGEAEFGTERFMALNETREKAAAVFLRVEEIGAESATVREFAEKYYRFVTEELDMPRHLTELTRRQEQQGLGDLAEETAQIFRMILQILDQIVELTGEEPFNLEEFLEIFRVGILQIRVGILPVSIDDLMLGTMQRTRVGQIRALVVLGANDGVLPCRVEDKGLFALSEMDRIGEEGFEICKVDSIRRQEEQLAIYRNLSRPSEHLWIGYSAASQEGEAQTPSELVDDLRKIFPTLTIQEDLANGGEALDLVGGPESTRRHMIDAMRSHSRDKVWKEVEAWYRREDPQFMERVADSLSFRNSPEPLGDRSAALFGEKEGRQVLSPSKLETYARCPFQYFLKYGLGCREDRAFEISPLEIGDVYHNCFMKVTTRLTEEDRWQSVTREECCEMTKSALEEIAAEYKEGLLSASGEERYRTHRIRETCASALWMLVLQVREGRIRRSKYEVPFSARSRLAPIELVRGDHKLIIEGRIDRLDTLDGGGVGIIDYKSGKNTLSVEEVTAGYRLQLMLYMKAAEKEYGDPAGIFYFHIHEKRLDKEKLTGKTLADLSEKIRREMRKEFCLNGILVDAGNNVRDMAGEFDTKSQVMGVKVKDGGHTGVDGCTVMTEEEFGRLAREVDRKLEELAGQMIGGEIPISPMRSGGSGPCDYCAYKSVCRFDEDYRGCSYRRV